MNQTGFLAFKKGEGKKDVHYSIENIDDLLLNKVTWSQDLVIKKEDSNLKKIRKFVFCTITEPSYSKLAKTISIFMSIIIVSSALEFSLETVYSLNNTNDQIYIFYCFELLFNIIFSIDYFGKIIFFPDYPKLPKFLVKPFWLIDLISILPFYIQIALEASGQGSNVSVLRIVRIVRIFRIFRLLKASKNMKMVHLLGSALARSKDAIFLLFFLFSNLLIFVGAFVFYSEQGISDQDNSTGLYYYTDGTDAGNVSAFQSIPHTMWYVAVTITTVGYGDLYIFTLI